MAERKCAMCKTADAVSEVRYIVGFEEKPTGALAPKYSLVPVCLPCLAETVMRITHYVPASEQKKLFEGKK